MARPPRERWSTEEIGRVSGTSGTRAERLNLVRRLTERFERDRVRYCHWKSNEHLGAGVRGETDLDLLVDPRERCEPALADLDFKGFDATRWARHPGIRDYIGMDWDTGRLVHLHWHEELSVGPSGSKTYRLPWEDRVLASRVRDPETGCYVADPAMELILLLVRAALKGRRRLNADEAREYRWLVGRIDVAGFSTLATDLLGERSGAAARDLIVGRPDGRAWQDLVRHARPRPASYRRARLFTSWAGTWRNRVLDQWHRLLQHVFRRAVPRRRTNPRGGRIVAVLGADGAGKSTVVADTTRWLLWKVDATSLYMGTGQGVTRLLRTVLTALDRRRGVGVRTRRPTAGGVSVRQPSWRSPRDVGRAVWAVVVAWDKGRRLEWARTGRDRGITVVCDRYPQRQVFNFNDGPLLAHWRHGPRGVFRALARWEFDRYERADDIAPDLVLRLDVTPEVAASRRDSRMDVEEIRSKVDGVRNLHFPRRTRVVDIDADASQEAVQLAVRRAVWDVL